MMTYNDESYYTINAQAVLGQVATGGEAKHSEEQLKCLQVPSAIKATFIYLEHQLGAAFEQLVSDGLLAAGKEKKEQVIASGIYHRGVSAITVVVDGGWSKRSHKHSYNAKSGVGVIFGASAKKLLFTDVRNKYCSVCAISEHEHSPPSSHQCYRNWNGTSCAMEGDIIAEGFQFPEQMHGVRYLWFIGDGHSSVYHAVVTGVPSHGRFVQKVECVPTMLFNANRTALKHYARIIQNIKDATDFLQTR